MCTLLKKSTVLSETKFAYPQWKNSCICPCISNRQQKQFIYFFLLQSLIYVFPSEKEDQENNFFEIYFTFSSS